MGAFIDALRAAPQPVDTAHRCRVASPPVFGKYAMSARLGLLDSTTIVMGSMIGSGIFIVSADIARMLEERGALRIVHDAAELASTVCDLLVNPTARATMGGAGRKTVDDNRGAVTRLMNFIEPLLPS